MPAHYLRSHFASRDIAMNNADANRSSRLFVHVVTYNSADTIRACLDSLCLSSGFAPDNLRIEVTDNASTDETRAQLSADKHDFGLHLSDVNTGFCEPHNRAVQRAAEWGADYLAVVNPDVAVHPDTLHTLVAALEADPSAAVVTPKLLRAGSKLETVAPAVLDAAGMYITPALRHFDRGSGQCDAGQFDEPQYVFGATGALLLLRLAALRDIAVFDSDPLQLFDERFFAYREDADLAWRMQLGGWRCRYEPRAAAFHVRRVTAQRRAELAPELNAFGVRNRFLLQFGNFSLLDCWRCLPAAALRNLLVLGAALTVERTSLPAVMQALKLRAPMNERRRRQHSARRTPPAEMQRWFSRRPAALPALALNISESPVRRLRIIVVNYNSGSRLRVCAAALDVAAKTLAGRREIEVAIFDNGSADASAARLEARYRDNPRFNFVLQERNLGFAGAINAMLDGGSYDAALILNPDVIISAGALEELCRQLEASSNLAAAAPVLTDVLGQVQHGFTVRRFPSFMSVAAEALALHAVWPANPWTAAARYAGRRDWRLRAELDFDSAALPYECGAPQVVEQPAGACLLVRREALERLGGFDSSFWPAWYEDVDFCRRLADTGLLAAVCPRARVIHEGGYSLQVISRGGLMKAWYPNLFRYWRKHHSRLSVAALHVLVRLGLLMRALAAAFELLRSDSAQSAAQAKGTLSAACSLLVRPDSRAAADSLALRAGTAWQRIVEAVQRSKPTSKPADKTEAIAEASAPSHDTWFEALDRRLAGTGLQISTNGVTLPKSAIVTVIEAPGAPAPRRVNGTAPVRPDLRADLEVLPGVIDDNYDFLVAVDVFHTLPNPLRALLNWSRVVKPRGLLYITLPAARNAVSAPLEHLIADYLRPSTDRDLSHYLDHCILERRLSGEAAIAEARSLQSRGERVALHVLGDAEMGKLVAWAAKHVAPLEILEQGTDQSGRSHWLLQVS